MGRIWRAKPAMTCAVVVLLLSLFALLAPAPVAAQTTGKSAPRAVTASPLSRTAVEVDWLAGDFGETSADGFLVTVRQVWPNPEGALATPACDQVRPDGSSQSGVQSSVLYPTNCVIDGLEPGGFYAVQVIELHPSGNSAPVTAWAGTYVASPTNLRVDYDWVAGGSTVTARWDLPSNRANITSHGARLIDSGGRVVDACGRHMGQAPTCSFGDVVEGPYRVEAFTYGGIGIAEPLRASVDVRRPAPTGSELELATTWRAEPSGQLFVRVAWNHLPSASEATYAASGAGQTCTATATHTLERLSCELPVTPYLVSFPLAVELAGGNVQTTTTVGEPPPHPAHPANVHIARVGSYTAEIAWDHVEGSNATTYVVWVANHSAECVVGLPFDGRLSCVLEGLQPNTSYQANVYADSQIGRRSIKTIRVNFTTEQSAVDPRDVSVSVEDLCPDNSRHAKRHDRVVNKAHDRYDAGVAKAMENLQNKPRKLANKIRKLSATRESRIAKAAATFAKNCSI